jgi:rhamnosyltransferase subunit B
VRAPTAAPPNDVPPSRSLHVLLPTIGSAGDVHPFIGLGLALRARGHRATLLTNPYFEGLIKQQGLGFLPVGTIQDFEEAIEDPNLWHVRKGFRVVARRVIVPATAEIYRLIESHADADTVVAASGISFGARVAQEKLKLPTATVHLQPALFRSLIDQGVMGNMRISAAQPMWFKQALFRLIDWAAIDYELKRPLNEFRSALDLPPVNRVLLQWMHSPQCIISLFPDWFATKQADWPPQTHLVGFPLWDAGGRTVSREAQDFLEAGEPPIIFTAGSAAATRQRFFIESVEAARQLKRRAMLVTNFPQQLPRDLPIGVEAFGYLPFSEVLPRAALLVYHGGIGTLAQTIHAGIPHLVVPNGHDQFDNGWRIEQLGLGRTIPQTRYRAEHAAAEIQAMLSDRSLAARAHEYAARIDSVLALTRACELIEELAVRRGD